MTITLTIDDTTAASLTKVADSRKTTVSDMITQRFTQVLTTMATQPVAPVAAPATPQPKITVIVK